MKIISDALKMIGSNCFSGRTRDLNFRGRFVKNVACWYANSNFRNGPLKTNEIS